MARQRRPAPQADADDLQRIQGIGPATERRLHQAGLRTFAQLAQASPDKLAKLVPGWSAERIAHAGWVKQARRLAGRLSPERLHYATFTVELLLDAANTARRTRVTHVQSGEEEMWAAWDTARLIRFMGQRAKLPARVLQPAAPAEAKPARKAAAPSPAEPLTSPHIEVDKFEVVDRGERRFSASRRLQAHLRFHSAGLPTDTAAMETKPVWVSVLGCELTTGQMTVLESGQHSPDSDQEAYSLTLAFDLPAAGRYQTLGLIVLPHLNQIKGRLGEILSVVRK